MATLQHYQKYNNIIQYNHIKIILELLLEEDIYNNLMRIFVDLNEYKDDELIISDSLNNSDKNLSSITSYIDKIVTTEVNNYSCNTGNVTVLPYKNNYSTINEGNNINTGNTLKIGQVETTTCKDDKFKYIKYINPSNPLNSSYVSYNFRTIQTIIPKIKYITKFSETNKKRLYFQFYDSCINYELIVQGISEIELYKYLANFLN
jgi:hypothetical protein